MKWNYAFPFYLWNIWLSRNGRTFSKPDTRTLRLTPYVRAREYFALAGKNQTIGAIRKQYIKWNLLAKGFKLNSDGSHTRETRQGGLGGVFRDHNGNWILGYPGSIKVMSPIQAKLLALIQGLKLAVQHKLTPLEINIDSEVVISYLHKLGPKYLNFVFDYRALLY